MMVLCDIDSMNEEPYKYLPSLSEAGPLAVFSLTSLSIAIVGKKTQYPAKSFLSLLSTLQGLF